MATYPSGLTRAFPEPDDFPTAAAWGVQLELALEEQPLGPSAACMNPECVNPVDYAPSGKTLIYCSSYCRTRASDIRRRIAQQVPTRRSYMSAGPAAQDRPAPGRVDRRKARTRQALIAAAQAFLAEGRTAVSIQDLTDRADVGFGSFYNHFESKDELFGEAVTSTRQTCAELRDQLVGIEDPAEVFAVSFRLTDRLQRRMPEQVRVLLHSGTRMLVHEQGLAPRARHDLAVAVEQGRFDLDDVELGFMAVGGALLGLLQMLEADPTLDDTDVSDRFTERVLRALGLDAAKARQLCQRPLPELADFG